jgi:hypothetical protein
MPTDDQNSTVVYVIQIDNGKDKMIGNLGNQLINVWRGRSSGLFYHIGGISLRTYGGAVRWASSITLGISAYKRMDGPFVGPRRKLWGGPTNGSSTWVVGPCPPLEGGRRTDCSCCFAAGPCGGLVSVEGGSFGNAACLLAWYASYKCRPPSG